MNDGSTDSSAVILDDLAHKDARIKVISKANGGVSSARNAGLDEATGKFVLFVDSDDWITSQMVKQSVAVADSETDLVLAGAVGGRYADNLGRWSLLCTVLRDETLNSPCGKLYRLSVLKENDIRFSDGVSIGEDLLFNVKFATAANGIVVLRDRHYRIRIVQGSLSRSYQSNKYNDLNFVHNQMRQFLQPYMNDHLDSVLNYLRIKMLASCSKTYFSSVSPLSTKKAREAVRFMEKENGRLDVMHGDMQMRLVAAVYNTLGLNALSKILRTAKSIRLIS